MVDCGHADPASGFNIKMSITMESKGFLSYQGLVLLEYCWLCMISDITCHQLPSYHMLAKSILYIFWHIMDFIVIMKFIFHKPLYYLHFISFAVSAQIFHEYHQNTTEISIGVSSCLCRNIKKRTVLYISSLFVFAWSFYRTWTMEFKFNLFAYFGQYVMLLQIFLVEPFSLGLNPVCPISVLTWIAISVIKLQVFYL